MGEKNFDLILSFGIAIITSIITLIIGYYLGVKQTKKLMEQGFKYETGEYHDGGKLFYKNK